MVSYLKNVNHHDNRNEVWEYAEDLTSPQEKDNERYANDFSVFE